MGERLAALAIMNHGHLGAGEVHARHRVKKLMTRIWRRGTCVRTHAVSLQSCGRLGPPANDRSPLQRLDDERQPLLTFCLLEQRARSGACEKHVHTASR